MQSFRSEIENPLVEKDIIDLANKIELFKKGKLNEEKFRSLRLARGVYGQRQFGVQMIRIKLPYGKVTSEQLHRICEVSDEYSTGKLHITTRQDIQIHYVSLDRTPELWAQLEKDDITLREACGNAVRNVTASETAGIDLNEAFDVTPYAHAVFEFFLRNPICQEMGRKFKMSFSATDEDSALSYIHDLGFIAKTKQIEGKIVKGFKVLLAGGLGSQPREADVAYQFLETDQIIPFIEGVLRVFDRHGERSKRLKARMKFLVKSLGLEAFLELVENERKALAYQNYPIEEFHENITDKIQNIDIPECIIEDQNHYDLWKQTNIIKQKQPGLVAIGIKVKLGDFYTDQARKIADLIKKYGANELRFSLRQNILLRNIPEDRIRFFYLELNKIGLADYGYNSIADITACPGTDTCNLGIASSTGIATVLEKVIHSEFPNLIPNNDIFIKISGCMNACGQHNMAPIGFQGMSIKSGSLVAPALQILLGGEISGNGNGKFADKVIKIPSKRGPEALRKILHDFNKNHVEDEKYTDYYHRNGKTYFYDLLKPLAQTDNLEENDFIDWGHESPYIKAVGVGECAGVVIDLITTLLFESEEKIIFAEESLKEENWSDSIYHSYASIVNGAKALLTVENKKTNTHSSIIKEFESFFIKEKRIEDFESFESFVYQINQKEPSKEFAISYLEDAKRFYKIIDNYRKKEVEQTYQNG